MKFMLSFKIRPDKAKRDEAIQDRWTTTEGSQATGSLDGG